MSPRNRISRHFHGLTPDEKVRQLNASGLGDSDDLEKHRRFETRESKAGWRFLYELYRREQLEKAGQLIPPAPADPEVAALAEGITQAAPQFPLNLARAGTVLSACAAIGVAWVFTRATLHGDLVQRALLTVILPVACGALKLGGLTNAIASPHQIRAVKVRHEREFLTTLICCLVANAVFALSRSFGRYVPHGFANLALWLIEMSCAAAATVAAGLWIIHSTPGHRFKLARKHGEQAHELASRLQGVHGELPLVYDLRPRATSADSASTMDASVGSANGSAPSTGETGKGGVK